MDNIRNRKLREIDIAKQVTWNTVGSFVLMLAQWGISVILVRMAGFSEAGIFSLAMSVSNIFTYFGNYSTRNYMTSDECGEYTYRQYIYTRMITVAAGVGLCLLFLLFAGYNFQTSTAIFLYILYAGQTMISDILYGCMQRCNHLEIGGIGSTVKGVFCFLAFMIVMAISSDLLLSMAVMAFVAWGVMIFYELPVFRMLLGKIGLISAEELRAIPKLLRTCFPLMLSLVLPMITVAAPRIVIERILGEELLGIYSSIYTPTVAITTFVPAVITGVVPMYAAAWVKNDFTRFKKLTLVTVFSVLGIGALACLVSFFFGKPVLTFLFGKEIEPYFFLLYFAILATTANAMTHCGLVLLTVQRQIRHTLFSTIVAMLLVCVGAYPFVILYGIYGAAYILAIGYSVQVVWQLIAIYIKLRKSKVN